MVDVKCELADNCKDKGPIRCSDCRHNKMKYYWEGSGLSLSADNGLSWKDNEVRDINTCRECHGYGETFSCSKCGLDKHGRVNPVEEVKEHV